MKNLHVVPEADGPTAEIYKVSPAVAKRWLSRNVRNRPIRKNVVEAYARDMKAGAWQITGEAIKFDRNGALSDGQHRLTAVVQSGVTVDMLVVRGLAPEAQAVMDSGSKRTASDALTFGGIKNASIVAAAARLALREPEAGYADVRIANPTNTEIAAFVTAHPRIKFAADQANHYYPAFDAPPSALALAWMRFEDAAGPFAAAEFFDAVAEMTTDGAGDPRLALIRRLATARRHRERLESKVYLSLIYRAWNAWRKGRTLKALLTEQRGDLIKVPEQVAS
jgi:hypothetical protein